MHAKLYFDSFIYRLDIRADFDEPEHFIARLEVNITPRSGAPTFLKTGFAYLVEEEAPLDALKVICADLVAEYEATYHNPPKE